MKADADTDGGLFRVAFAAMGGDNEVVVATGDGDEARASSIAALAVDEVLRIERKYSRYRDDSVVAAINREAGGAPVPVDAESEALFAYADACFEQSAGRFDITSGVYRRVWSFRGERTARPSPDALAAARARVGWRRVERKEGAIRLPLAGMEIDLGGIGKEYAADRAATLMHDNGARHGLVNLGGDLRVFGGRPDGGPWRVGIRDPRGGCARREDACAIAFVDLVDGAVATSGDERRFAEVDGRRLSHVVDATTGEPIAEWRSISVVAPLAVVAGSHATIAMLWRDEAQAFLDRAGFAWLGIDAASDVHGSLRGEARAGSSAP